MSGEKTILASDIVDFQFDPRFCRDFWKTLAYFRNAELRILRSRLARLQWTVLILVPPSGHCFVGKHWDHFPRMVEGMRRWLFERSDLEAVHQILLREFAELGMQRESDIPYPWLGDYGYVERYGKSPGLMKYRWEANPLFFKSIVLPTSIESIVVELIESMLTDLGTSVLCPVEDGFSEQTLIKLCRAKGDKEVIKDFPYLRFFGGIPADDDVQWQQLMEQTIGELEFAIGRLDANEPLTYPVDPWSWCLPPRFGVPMSIEACAGSKPQCELEWYHHSVRSRFARLLGWPQLISSAEMLLSEHLIRQPILPTSVPYSPVEEMKGLVEELFVQYPWMAKDPFAT